MISTDYACEHKNIEFLYTSLVEDGLDTVVKCKDCGKYFVFKGCLVSVNGFQFPNPINMEIEHMDLKGDA